MPSSVAFNDTISVKMCISINAVLTPFSSPPLPATLFTVTRLLSLNKVAAAVCEIMSCETLEKMRAIESFPP